MKKMLVSLIALGMLAGMVHADDVVEHSGRTDKNGCHVDRKTGIRHCH